MKPSKLNSDNWDVNVAVLDLGDTEVRIFYIGTAIWFSQKSSILRTHITIPIKTWKKIVSFVAKFKKEDLGDVGQTGFLPDRKHEVLIHDSSFRSQAAGRTVRHPLSIMIGELPNGTDTWQLVLFLRDFKKIVKWYETDV